MLQIRDRAEVTCEAEIPLGFSVNWRVDARNAIRVSSILKGTNRTTLLIYHQILSTKVKRNLWKSVGGISREPA